MHGDAAIPSPIVGLCIEEEDGSVFRTHSEGGHSGIEVCEGFRR